MSLEREHEQTQEWVFGCLPCSDYCLTVNHGRGQVSKRMSLRQAGRYFVNPYSPSSRSREG